MIIFIPLCSVIYSLLRTNVNERLKRRRKQEEAPPAVSEQ